MNCRMIEKELCEMIERLVALPELNMDDLEFRSIMTINYAKTLLHETSRLSSSND